MRIADCGIKNGMMEYWNVAARDDLFSFKNPLFHYSSIPTFHIPLFQLLV
jgi:hypothetical protein